MTSPKSKRAITVKHVRHSERKGEAEKKHILQVKEPVRYRPTEG
jgi:hypothetical protein